MRKADFARLCGVSAPMIAKYCRAGLIATGEAGVDAAASLKALQGHLNEEKRIAAILALADGKRAPDALAPRVRKPDAETAPPAKGFEEPPHPAVIQLAEYQAARSADRSRLERAAADIKEIELLQLTGQLIDAKEVAKAIEDSVVSFWIELQRREREEADAISAQLGLDQLQARRLRDALRTRNLRMRDEYAAAMRRLAAETRPPSSGEDAAAR